MIENHHQTTQVIGGVVAVTNQNRLRELHAALGLQSQALAEALEQIQNVRSFVGTPEHILGNPATKHGEIAEQVEVGIRNARNLVNQHPPVATFAGVGRTASADYRVDGVEVQSKFINGATKGLDHVLEHMEKYKNFGRDGSYYHLPRDQHELFQKILNGEAVDGLAAKTVRKIQTQIQAIEQKSGKPFNAVVKPGVSSYSEAQQGNIHETLDGHEDDIREQNVERQVEIELEHQASLYEMAQVALKGAAIGAGLKVTFKLIEQITKEKKNPFKGEFTLKDWQDLGISTAQGGATGGVSGAAIYAMTNFADLSAPLAGAILSACYSVASLANHYQKGLIDLDEFFDLGQIACAESAMVAIGAALGQGLIPLPVMGTVIGTIASRMVIDFGKNYLNSEADKLQQELDSYCARWMQQLDKTYQSVMATIIAEVQKLGDLMDAAFDQSKNAALRLQASINLAIVYGVPEVQIIHTTDELDCFMLT